MKKRILAVDDSASMRQMIAYTLQNAGFEVISKIDGMDALAWAKENSPPDLVLSDINMPNMDGLTLIRSLRSLTEYKYIPILVLTTESLAAKKLEGKQAGASGWIVKPFNPEQLIKTIHMVMKK